MKFRLVGWGRTLFFLFVSWIVFVVVVLAFLKHDVETNYSDRIAQAMQKLQLLQKRDEEMRNLFLEFSNGLKDNQKEELLNRLGNVSANINLKSRKEKVSTADYENVKRRLYSNIRELWHFSNAQIKAIQKKLDRTKTALNSDLSDFLTSISNYKSSLLNDINALSELDGYVELLKMESANLSDIVQRRLYYLQHPTNCETAQKLVCDLNKGCGFGCQLHHVVYCLLVAYGTERTLILKSDKWRYSRLGWEKVFLPLSSTCITEDGLTKSMWPGTAHTQVVTLPIIDGLTPRPHFLPLSIPEDLAPRMIRVHADPIVWWIGQFLKYLLRPQPHIRLMLDEYEKKLAFQKPIVGLHVRRTDKIGTEASYHSLEEYMFYAEDFYKTAELYGKKQERRIYIASDDPKIFEEAKIKYPNYKVIGDASISKSASMPSRYSENSLKGIITDIHFLSKSDFVVCTFSSQVCRTTYEIMSQWDPDAAFKFQSLDDLYYYGGQKARIQVAIIEHDPKPGTEEIELKIGDRIGVAGNHWNGFSKGTNMRTDKIGLYPTFKVKPEVDVEKFPTYPQVPV